MGRFATELAVAVANVDGLHAKDIKNVSLWDALLPKQYTADATPISKQKKEVSMSVQVKSRSFSAITSGVMWLARGCQ